MRPEASAGAPEIDRVGGEFVVRRPASLPAQTVEVSLVMPCYNEEAAIGETAPSLIEAFREAGVDLELVLVDNGSRDRTGAIIDELMMQGLPITKVEIPTNRGYSHGIRMGLEACRAPIIGYLCADGQVAPADVMRTYRLMAGREERVLAKVRRRFRQDSWKRKIVSITYNGLMQAVFGWLGAIDINGSPKIFSRAAYRAMRLRSDDWFLDPEIILKARELGLRVIEIDVEGYARHSGVSNVRRQTMLEFLKNIWEYRTGSYMAQWRREAAAFRASREEETRRAAVSRPERPGPDTAGPLVDRVQVLPQPKHEDARGFLQKVLTASQWGHHGPRGEVYVTAARPGEAKGNHYHRLMGEWFAVVQGEGDLVVEDPATGDRRTIHFAENGSPRTIFVPPGLAHAVVNTGRELLLCVALAEREHDPGDVVSHLVWPPAAERPPR